MYTLSEIKALVEMGFTPAQIASMDAKAPVGKKAQKKSATKAKTATFMKYNVATGKRDIAVPCTEAQKAVWEKHEFKTFDAEAWEKQRKAFKPSKALKDAIKANPVITRKQAKELGFVGTRDDLKALKAQVLKK